MDGTVVLPARVCAGFAPIIRERVDWVLRQGRRVDDAYLAELEAMECAASAYSPDKAPDASPDGRGEIGTLESMEVVGLRPAAKVMGIAHQTLAEMVDRGTMPSRRDARGRHVFRRENLTAGRSNA
jgi:hypothetical protein